MADLKVHVIQDETGAILAIETSLKKLIVKHGERLSMQSYQHTNRLKFKAKNEGLNEIQIKSKEGVFYTLSWWEI